ncbi:hypothetical protein [Amycolatopsis australiensis]|uniref:Uncharacterized protein n=1 Tax=Amycolatopsis australiensis TaxID=546364 RepID=A0A1K1RF58_9PSEU|nr:hypothetical protein [Amycolatopsis australiensis]SFW70318.1 hypothetical protein SAMN04489730_3094 [Amycolatopsis australiensis]
MAARASFTAETMALQRAFETHRPPGRRRFEDPYATAFLRPSLRVLAERGFVLESDVSAFEAGGGSRLYRIAVARNAHAAHQ